jgi:prepilin signal peptidase PulO-like enzyme (type II secretory pathway)
MAPPKLNFSANFITQILLGAFFALIFMSTGYDPALSIFLGVLGGLALGWVSASTKTGPRPETVATSEGIDAGLKYWLFFLLGFVFVGYQPPMSILLGAIAGIGGGWIIAWWGSKEETRTQLPSQVAIDESEETEATSNEKPPRRQMRRATRRYRRRPGSINFRFWER